MEALLLLIAGVTAAVILQWNKAVAAWKAAARSLGVDYEKRSFGYPQLHGTVDGFEVDARIRKSGNTMFSRYEVAFPPLPVDLQVRRRSGLVRIAEMFGAQDVALGDPTFDELFQVQSSQPEQTAQILTPPVRAMLVSMAKDNPRLTESTLTVERRKQDRDAQVITQTVRRLVGLADQLSGRRRRATPPPAPPKDHPPAIEELTADPWTDEDPTSASVPWMPDQTDDTLVSEPLAPVFDETAGRDGTAGAAASKKTAAPDEATEPELSPVQVAEALFGGDLLSFEATQVFADRYAGKPVRWEGTVVEPGIVDAGSVETKLFGTLPIRVQVPGGFAPAGSEVLVAGTLSAMDPFERTLTVEGRLIRR